MGQQQGSPFPLLIMILVYLVIGFWPGYKIAKKAGFDWRMAVCLAVPGFNILAWFALAFMEWPIHKYLPKDVKK